MIWVLILFAHAGPFSDKDSMALTNVPGFHSEQACIAAGEKTMSLARNTTKVIKYSCIKVD